VNLAAFRLIGDFFQRERLLEELPGVRDLSIVTEDEFTVGEMRVLSLFGPIPTFEKPSPFHNYLRPQEHPELFRFKIMQRFLAHFGDQLLMARCIFLSSKAQVIPHRDPNRSFEFGVARLNVPLIHFGQMSLSMGSTEMDVQPGEVWYLDGATKHSVLNPERGERVSLVIDVKISPSLLSHFPDFARKAYFEIDPSPVWTRPPKDLHLDCEFEAPRSLLPFFNPREDLVRAKIFVDKGEALLTFSNHSLELDFNDSSGFFSPRWVGPGFSYRPEAKKLEIHLKGLVPRDSSGERTFEWRTEVDLL